MEVAFLEELVVATVTRYGRPPTAAQHLEKLGEEFGELSSALALIGPRATMSELEHVADEATDMMNVLISLMHHCGYSMEGRVLTKLRLLDDRMEQGRYDRKWGQKA